MKKQAAMRSVTEGSQHLARSVGTDLAGASVGITALCDATRGGFVHFLRSEQRKRKVWTFLEVGRLTIHFIITRSMNFSSYETFKKKKHDSQSWQAVNASGTIANRYTFGDLYLITVIIYVQKFLTYTIWQLQSKNNTNMDVATLWPTRFCQDNFPFCQFWRGNLVDWCKVQFSFLFSNKAELEMCVSSTMQQNVIKLPYCIK